MEAVKATIFGNLSTAISVVAGIAILGEPFAYYNIICTAVIIVGVIGVSAAGAKG
jgi:multidrug transporter EmrE-like cation transporter